MKILNPYIRKATSSTAMLLSLCCIITVLLLVSCGTQKTTYSIPDPKAAPVSDARPFKDKIQCPFDDKGLDLNVGISFNEADNLLTLCITGTRQLMVFRQDIFCGTIFNHPFGKQRVLDPKKLPYPVLIQPNMKIYLSKNVWDGFRNPKNQHLFNNWLVGVSPELEALTPTIATDNSPEATLIVDSIVQRFRVNPKATKASFTLRNFLVVDKDGLPVAPLVLKRNPSTELNYEIVYEKDLNLTYNVQLQRNPCFGKDSLIAAANARIKDVMKGYAGLHDACPTGVVDSQAAVGVFKQHRAFLQSQFPAITDSTDCSDLQSAYDKYNLYVDSIANAPCVYIKPADASVTLTGTSGYVLGNGLSGGVRASTLLDAAHRLDNMVAQLMVTNDMAQIHDITQAGSELIQTMARTIRDKGIVGDDQRKAFEVYNRARTYFTTVVLRR